MTPRVTPGAYNQAQMPATSVTKRIDANSTSWLGDLDAWRTQRVSSLLGPFGWWSITCLVWLDEGANTVGSGANSTVSLAQRLPGLAAILVVDGARLTITPAAGANLTLGDGHKGGAEPFTEPLTVTGDQAFIVGDEQPVMVNVVRRGDAWGVRVHDPVHAAGKSVTTDVAWFGAAPEWALDAEFLPATDHEEVPISNVIGQVSMQPVAGRVRFEHAGASYTLLATPAGGGKLFINFRDASNQDYDHQSAEPMSYSGGRFLVTDAQDGGRVTLDFNRAYHPPCAHTPYATCPVPTPGNTLPFAVAAGERLP